MNTTPASTQAISPPELSKQVVLTKCEYFCDVQLWPLSMKLDPIGWLENFQGGETEYAVHLLNAFMYFSETLVDELFVASFHSLSNIVTEACSSWTEASHRWAHFCDNVVITYITGETPSVTDSGYSFARRARKLLGIPEARILSPEGVLNHLTSNGTSPVVFVDDFVGSGNQCMETWHREYDVNGRKASFASFQQLNSDLLSFFCPIVSTESGVSHIQRACTGLRINCPHVLSQRYSALAADSYIWPVNLRSGASAFLESVSKRAKIPPSKWKGFDDLALAIGFSHCIPDASLPLFHWNKDGWKPLMVSS